MLHSLIMNVTLCSVPVELPGSKMLRERGEGDGGVRPKTAICSLNMWSKQNGFGACKYYDIDMLYPSDEDVEKFFRENPTDIVGLSAVVSVSCPMLVQTSVYTMSAAFTASLGS